MKILLLLHIITFTFIRAGITDDLDKYIDYRNPLNYIIVATNEPNILQDLDHPKAVTMRKKLKSLLSESDYKQIATESQRALNLALAGDGNSQYLLSKMLHDGILTYIYYTGSNLPDKNVSFYWLKEAAGNNNLSAIHDLGEAFLNGSDIYDTEKDPQHAAKIFEIGSKKGDPSCQVKLGYIYSNGIGTAKDDKLAFKYNILASERNHPGALFNVGLYYFLGKGVKKNHTEAKKYLSKSLEYKNGESLYYLGLIYFNGEELEKDYIKSYSYWACGVRRSRTRAALCEERAIKILNTLSPDEITEAQRQAEILWDKHQMSDWHKK